MKKVLLCLLLVGVLFVSSFSEGLYASEVSQSEINALIVKLQSANFGEVIKAQQKLGEIGEPAVPLLRLLLRRSADHMEKQKVINVLGSIGTESSISAMVEIIGDDNEYVRNAIVKAATGLNQESKESAVPLFAQHLISDKSLARDTAVRSIQGMEVSNADLAEILIDLAQAHTGAKQKLAFGEIGKLGPEASGVVPELMEFVDPDNLDLTVIVLETVAKVGGDQSHVAVEIAEPMLLSTDWDVRQDAILILRRIKLTDEQMVAPVMNLFASGEEADQLLAIEILTQLGITQPAAVDTLIALVDDQNQNQTIRQAAYAGLEELYFPMEYHIGRGLVAVNTEAGVFLSWRLLGTEVFDLGFNVYRNGVKINAEPITTSTNYLDAEGNLGAQYYVTAILAGTEQAPSKTVTALPQNYLSVALQKPASGRTPRGESYGYSANDASLADLDGDGEYEIILKWDPSNSQDNSLKGYTGNVYIDAYKLDGTLMWRIDLGKNIRAGAHYTQFMVYDLDGDGKAEVVMKTADGTIDGVGKVIGNRNADHRNSNGYILTGPEYLTVFSGETGAELQTINYAPPRGNVSSWGDSYGNRVDRFLAAIAYLDGDRPSVVMARGYYTRAVIVAYNWDGEKLQHVWTLDSNDPGKASIRGQGNHQLSVADVDFDGKDEIIYGAATIDHDGSILYSTGLGHGDALHVGDFDPDRVGLEVFAVHENKPNPAGINLRDARTGEIIWGIATNADIGRGLAANIDPRYPGAQAWASGSYGMLNAVNGEQITSTRPAVNFAIWWDGDLEREILDNVTISKWDWEKGQIVQLLYAQGTASNNTTKATPTLTADVFGDWREELVLRSGDSRELRIYTTTDVTDHRLYTLMHDRQYRLAVAWQNVAYNQPPHPSYYIGSNMAPQTYNPGRILGVLEQYASEFGN